MDSTVWTRYANKITINPQAFQDRIPGFLGKKTHRNVRISLASQDPIPGFPEKKTHRNVRIALASQDPIPGFPGIKSLASQDPIPGFPEKNLPLNKNKKRQFFFNLQEHDSNE